MKHLVLTAVLMISVVGIVFAFQTQNSDIGILYVQLDSGFRMVPKVAAKVTGKTIISGAIPGPTSSIRLTAGQIPHFQICGVDPTRYKLYILKSKKNERVLDITKRGGLFSAATSLLNESEIEISIQAYGAGCFLLAPKESLDRGEYGFSPVDSNDIFDFGIGELKAKTK